MADILNEIIESIKNDEGEKIASFKPSTFKLNRQKPPRDIIPLLARNFFLIAEIKKASHIVNERL